MSRRRTAPRRTSRRRAASGRRVPPATWRGRRNRWLVLIAIGLILAVVTGRTLGGSFGGDTGSTPDTTPSSTVEYRPIPGADLVDVARIIDGDTLVVRDRGEEVTVRLFGVDTPERGEACYPEATERLAQLAADHVQLLTDDRLTDRFGRVLRYVYTTDGQLVDKLLVAEGLGLAWQQDGQYRDEIVALEETARLSQHGCLWLP